MTDNDQAREALKPCPFCSAKATIGRMGRDWYRLEADHDDDCIMWENVMDVPQTDDQLEALIRDWNRRAPLQHEAIPAWLPIESAPIDEEVLVIATMYSMLIPEPRRMVAKKYRGNSWWAGPIPLSHVMCYQPLPAAPQPAQIKDE